MVVYKKERLAVRYSDEVRGEVARLKLKGVTQIEISRRTGVGVKTVGEILKERNLNGYTKRGKECRECFKTFTSLSGHSKFCCDKCRMSYNRKNNGSLEKVCKQCKETFFTYQSSRIYCGTECYNTYLRSVPKREVVYSYEPVAKICKKCEWCEVEFKTSKKNNARYCSTRCASNNISYRLSNERKNKNLSIKRECNNCGISFNSEKNVKCCSSKCLSRYSNRNKDIRKQRMVSNGKMDKNITLDKLYLNDGGMCYLCGDKCDRTDYVVSDEGHTIVGKQYPSIDHVKPISKGGTHTWENVKLAHHYCNSVKSDTELCEAMVGR